MTIPNHLVSMYMNNSFTLSLTRDALIIVRWSPFLNGRSYNIEMTEMSLALQFPDDLCQLRNIHNFGKFKGISLQDSLPRPLLQENKLRSDLKLENLVLYLCLSLLSLSLWST